ncbi:MAG: thiamine pyrophosphate-binding protein [Candidatus Omnitrophica bacterium]|nr:thiamine pyrophosphate-binding protein [Candidatus Omnitrophota bacterium]
MMRVSDYIAGFLLQRGVKDIFMLTGNGAMYLNDAISQSGIRYVCARNEAAAPMMAEAYARVKQSLGAVCVTSGPGSTNAVPGLAEAWVDAAPILILSGQVQRSHTTHNAGLKGLRTFGTAEINIIPIVSTLTKYAVMVNEAESIRYHLEKAYTLATTGRPGPVWLDIPMDIQYAPVDPEHLKGYTPPQERTADLEVHVDALLERLARAKRPLLIGGHGIRQGRASTEFRELVELLHAPAIFSRFGQDLLPFSHPFNLGQAGVKGSRYCGSVMKSADLVISLGCRLAVQMVGHKFDAFHPGAKVVMVDLERDELDKPGVKLDLAIQADVKPFLTRLVSRLKQETLPDWSDWLGRCQELKRDYPMVTPAQRRNPIDLYYFMSRLDALADRHHIFVTDAGSNYYVGGQVYHFEKGQREITSGTFAAMGLSIPLAIGASIARPDAQILAVTGDGSLELNIQELKTLSHYGLNVKLFVINNGGYVSMRNWQDGHFEGRRIDTEQNTGIGTLNLQRIAHAFDMPYDRIERVEEIDGKVGELMQGNGPVFAEVFCDQNQRIVEPIKDLSFNAKQKEYSIPV